MLRIMSAQDVDLAADVAVSANKGLWRAEFAATLKLALPIALTQLGQIAMMTTDLALVGRLGERAVAAAALAQIVLFAGFIAGMGLVSAVAPLASQAFGARQPRMVRRALRVGLWATLVLGIPITAIQFQGERLLLAAGQEPEAAALAGRYLHGLAWSVVPGWWFIALRGFMGAVNRPEPALWIMLAAIPINAFLAYGLIYGAFGLPNLDLLGAGVATTIVNIVMCAACIWVCYVQHPFKKYRVLGRLWRLDWPLLGRLLMIGLPISGAFLLEYGVFAAAGLLMGWISNIALAAHQIALQVAAVMFMVPFGVSMAATVRVGHAVGRRDASAARRAGLAAITLGAIFMVAMTLIVALTRHVIPIVFLGIDVPRSDPTVVLSATLLLLGASFFLADGVQTVAAGALRGLNDTRVPLIYSAISFWAIAFVAAYGLAFGAGLGAEGVWIGLSIGLLVFATLLVWRFHSLTRRGYLPELAGPA